MIVGVTVCCCVQWSPTKQLRVESKIRTPTRQLLAWLIGLRVTSSLLIQKLRLRHHTDNTCPTASGPNSAFRKTWNWWLQVWMDNVRRCTGVYNNLVMIILGQVETLLYFMSKAIVNVVYYKAFVSGILSRYLHILCSNCLRNVGRT